MAEKNNREIMEFVVSNGRVETGKNGLLSWESLSNEIEFEAAERGWDANEIKDAVEWAYNTDKHDGHQLGGF